LSLSYPGTITSGLSFSFVSIYSFYLLPQS
jgi:hypothetical protein